MIFNVKFMIPLTNKMGCLISRNSFKSFKSKELESIKSPPIKSRSYFILFIFEYNLLKCLLELDQVWTSLRKIILISLSTFDVFTFIFFTKINFP